MSSTIPGLANQATPLLTDLLEISRDPGSFNISISQLSAFYQLTSEKGAVSGYAGLDASQELLLTNFPTGTALQVLRRNAGNTALEFATDTGSGITTLNSDTAAVQTLTGGDGITITDVTPDHSFAVDATVARSTDNLSFFAATTSAQLAGVISDETGSGLLVFGTSPTIVTPTIASFVNATHDHSNAAGGGQLLSTTALSDTGDIAYLNTANVFGDFDQTFKDNRILIESPDGLTPTTLVNAQQTVARNLTIPILTGNRNIVVTTESSQITLGTEVTGASTDLTDTANIARNSDNLSFFAATTSAQLAGVISDETGTGLLVFGTSPTIVTPTIASFTNATHDHTNATGGGTLLSTTALSDTANIAYLNTANAWTTGLQNFAAVTLRIPVSATPSVTVDGDIAYDTTVTDFSTGLIKFFGTEEQGIVAMPIAQFTTPSDGFVVAYNATNDEFELVAAGAGDMVLASVQTVTGAKTFGTIGGAVGKFILAGSTSGSTILNAAAIAGTTTVTLQGITGTVALLGDKLDAFAATTSAELATVISDETGSGLLVFGTSPTIVTPTIASFTNSTHDHSNATGGGNLTNTALTSGVFAAITGLGVQSQALDLGGNDLDNIQNLINDLSTSGTDVDFAEDMLQEISISANTTFTGTGYAIGKCKILKITTDGTLRTLTFPSGWVFLGTKPADQAASKTGILSLTSFTAAEAGIVAVYAVEA